MRMIAMTSSLLFGVLLASGCSSAPTDNELIASFYQNRECFQTLKETLRSDAGVSVVMHCPEWSSPANLSQEKKQFYYDLLARIGEVGVSKGVSRDGDLSLRIDVWGEGFVSHGNDKGYVYRPDRRGSDVDYVEDLDAAARTARQTQFSYRKIEGDWYLYYDHWD